MVGKTTAKEINFPISHLPGKKLPEIVKTYWRLLGNDGIVFA